MLFSPYKKPGRNEPCHCGSGKKYKKCCIDIPESSPVVRSRSVVPEKNHSIADRITPVLLYTTTGEPFTPARLYYKVHDKEKLAQSLRALRCISLADEDKNIFDLTYWHEAKKIRLSVPYDRVPEELFPVLLAVCHIRDNGEMTVDVRSFERAWRMVAFLDRHISRKIAEVTSIATYNRMIKCDRNLAEEVMSWDYDEVFSAATMHIVTPSEFPDREGEEPPSAEEEQKFHEEMDKKINEPLPLTTKIPVHFYEDGISGLKFTMMMRMHMAAISAREGKQCSLADILLSMKEDIAA